MDLTHTANQPIGPFFHFALTPGWATSDNSAGVMAGPEARGERIRLTIRVLDRDGNAVTNAMIELWQADAGGKYNHPADTQKKTPTLRSMDSAGWRPTTRVCAYSKQSSRAGFRGSMASFQAPHINVTVYAPGLLLRAVTRIYFDGDPRTMRTTGSWFGAGRPASRADGAARCGDRRVGLRSASHRTVRDGLFRYLIFRID